MILKQFMTSLGQMMVLNASNIVVIRMQNVDYKHNRSLTKAVKDLFVVDKHRMFYKGLLPFSIAFANLHSVQSVMNVFRSDDNILTHYLWPFMFVLGCGIVHPFFLLGMRVQCSHFSTAPLANSNTISCSQHIMRTQGRMGFYRGFAPSLLMDALISHEYIFESA